MIGIMVIPLFMAIWLGMNLLTFRNINSPQFIGLQNYLEVLADPRFFKALQFTLLIMVITVPLQMTIGFVAALLLDQIAIRWRGIFMAGLLLPFIVVPVVGSMMVKQLFEPSGLASWFFREVIEQRFVLQASTIRPLIYLHTIWYVTPFAIVAFYAGMQTVRKDLVDSAAIDGASRLQQIRHVMIPHLRSVIIFIFLISIMDSYRIFDSIFVFSELNPIFNADTVMTYNFITATAFNRLGKANAMAILVVIGILVVLIPFIIVTYRDQIRER